nr:hypothetical protein Iba_chr01bCG0470 [Ipomoea batatas]GMC50832.1 hypothetical protein Iba_chr01cCG0560 [Ipomoea batatas]GMD12070.1 hypothetical protein Iba_scaffold68202CG0010 [Ipomoea batatas]
MRSTFLEGLSLITSLARLILIFLTCSTLEFRVMIRSSSKYIQNCNQPHCNYKKILNN